MVTSDPGRRPPHGPGPGGVPDRPDRFGLRGTPARVRLLTAVVLAAALAAAAVGLALPTRFPPDDPLGPLGRFGIAAAVFGIAQLARLRFRAVAGMVSITWGEAALIVSLYLAPAGWLPAAALLGTALTWGLMSVLGDRRSVFELVRIVASVTVATALAVSVTTALGAPFLAAPTPALALALLAGSATYLLASAWLGGLTLALRHGLTVAPPLLAALRGKLLMFVGNVAVGLLVVALIRIDPRWLLLLPPPCWLLQQTYRHRLRAEDERRTWRAFAEATGTLNQLDERDVATAAVTGALTLFRAERVDVHVVRRDGRWWRYRGDVGGQVVVRADAPPEAARSTAGHELARSLTVGATHVGELRVRFSGSVGPSDSEQDAFTAFSDALAAALHDAATHRELRRVTARSSYDAVHDPLTGLVNRAALLSRGDEALRQVPHGRPVALLLLDVNHFKEVNDTLGHSAGDHLLRSTANRLGALVHPGDLLGRLGGDEFALLMTGLPMVDDNAPTAYALRQAREIVERLAAPTEVAGVRMSTEVSVGVVVAGAGTADLTELLRRADIAMYQAKEGGGSVAAYDGSRDEANTDQLTLLAELREALATDDQLVLALQPAVDLATGAPTGVEALVRWAHPRRGMLGPADFIRPVEQSEQLGAFTRYILDKALGVAAGWARTGLDVPISVNLSARSLLDPRLPAEIGEALRRHKVPPRRLVLEITETVVMSELEVVDEVLGALRAMGVQLAVDDFGTGFSSLTFLTRVPVDEVKVDRSFVIRMADSPEAAAIVRTTVGLAQELGLRVVAEGVETAEQRLALAELGCTAAQGYHFFKPMPADKITTVLGSLFASASAKVLPLRADGVS